MERADAQTGQQDLEIIHGGSKLPVRLCNDGIVEPDVGFAVSNIQPRFVANVA